MGCGCGKRFAVNAVRAGIVPLPSNSAKGDGQTVNGQALDVRSQGLKQPAAEADAGTGAPKPA
ncbi:hypothetical protein [Chelativorans alearense]|uniref:hypothetical protein n=1 Tax=Chelativorans alearense TaxID=2681495 RepID=UPI0013D6CD93|nr:hypothetical protein [Chelativorans alearense]